MADTPYDTSGDLLSWAGSQAGTNALSSALLGKDTKSAETGSQDTTSTTAQNTTGSTSTAGSQGTTGTASVTGSQGTVGTTNTAGSQNLTQGTTGTSNTTGATNQIVNAITGNNSTGSMSGTQATSSSGTTTGSTTGSTRTTGSITNTGTTTDNSVQSSVSTADTAGLRDVYARQIAGLTPAALQAIFQEGSKNVPSLVNAQATALGARVDGNTPLARVMKDLNVDLTSKAAMLNMQMLSDAGTTAGKIADATKSITTTNSGTQTTTSTQVQDLLARTSQEQMTKQLQDAIVNSSQQTAQHDTQTQQSTTAGTQSQNTAQNQQMTQNSANQQSQNTAQTVTNQQQQQTVENTVSQQLQQVAQAVTGTQTQNIDTSKQNNTVQQQVLNSNLLGKVASAVGTGIGIAKLLQMAKSSGFTGDVTNFITGLLRSGVSTAALNKELAASNLAQITLTSGNLEADIAALAPSWNQQITDALSSIPDFNVPDLPTGGEDIGDWLGDIFGWADGGLMGYADGGTLQPTGARFLAVPNLLKDTKPQVIQAGDDGLSSMMSALGLGSGTVLDGVDIGTSSGSGGVTPSTSATGETLGDGAAAAAPSTNPAVSNTIAATVISTLTPVPTPVVNALLNVLNPVPTVDSTPASVNATVTSDSNNSTTSNPSNDAAVSPAAAAVAAAVSNTANSTNSTPAAPTPNSAEAAIANAIANTTPVSPDANSGDGAASGASVGAGVGSGVGSAAGAAAGIGAAVGSGDGVGAGIGSAAVGAGIGAAVGAAVGAVGSGDGAAASASGDGDGGSAASGEGVGVGAGEGVGGAGGGGGGGGGCFLTTAALDATGGDDSHPVMQTMRDFRDNVMRKDPQLSKLVDKYYEVAPKVVQEIDKRQDAKEVYAQMRSHFIEPGVEAVRSGDTTTALRYYGAMMEHIGGMVNSKAGNKMEAGAAQLLAAMGGMADGGHIQGPGSGVSDSILALSPNGPIRVANGEYIVPADTVKAIGVDTLDKLVASTHIPAAMQRAMTGDC